jgi:AraC-like DNA-binding protein
MSVSTASVRVPRWAQPAWVRSAHQLAAVPFKPVFRLFHRRAGLRMHRSTHQHHAYRESTSVRDILNDVRHESACALLQDPSLSVGDVAFFLQYSEPAAFHRAFRRWTGQTPREFRAALSEPAH